jgi:hypothetical protein
LHLLSDTFYNLLNLIEKAKNPLHCGFLLWYSVWDSNPGLPD